MRYVARTIAAALLSMIPSLAYSETQSLKFATFLSDRDINWQGYLKPFIDSVNANGVDLVQIESFPNGALGRSVAQQAQLVLDGVADITFVVPSLSSGRFPDDALFELPGLLQNISEGSKLNQTLMKRGLLRGYSDFVVLASMANVNNYVFSRKPITQLSDLSGHKVRILGPVSAQAAKALGMVPIQIAPTEVVEALGRGTIDSVFTVPSALFDFGMAKVTSYDYHLGLGSNSFAVLMNRQKFEALPKTAQDLLRSNADKFIGDRYVEVVGQFNQGLLEKLEADKGRTTVNVSEADRAAADKIFGNVAKDWAAKSTENNTLLEEAKKILNELRATK